MKLPHASLAFLITLATPVAAQTVHVVDVAAGQGSSFTSVVEAVTAAADGDVILVRTGTYPEVVSIVGKSLTLQGDPEYGPVPEIEALVITDLEASASVNVRGLHLRATTTIVNNNIELRNNAGPVWLEELSMTSSAGLFGNGFLVEDCAAVVVNACHIGAYVRFDTEQPPVLFVRSSVHVFDTLFDEPFANQTDGPPGIRAEGPGVLGVFQSTVTGADGVVVDGGHGFCSASNGGAGIDLEGDVELFVQDSVIQGGIGAEGCGYIGTDGPAFRFGTGDVHMLSSLARTHRATSGVRDDDNIDVTLIGEPGDRVRVFFTLRRPIPPIFLSVLDGPILVSPPLMRVSHGTLPASGMRSLSLPVGDLGPGVSSLVIYTQALFIGSQGELVMSEPTAVTLLDEGF
jgi:hypothetical protein